MGRWQKGQTGNPAGGSALRTERSRLRTMVVFDIREAARAHCERAIEKLAEHMESDDERVSTMACIAMVERGYGKPEQRTDASVTHKFAVVPEVMAEDEWLARKGQPAPKLLPPPKTNGTSH